MQEDVGKELEMADDYKTCCTVESPSRLILFYPDSTPSSLTTLLPTLPVCKLVGEHLVMGRSSSADVRLNDDRMSRAYASVWHDGKDPFIFRVSNLSERKLLMVDGVMLRYKEEAEVKDGSVLVLDCLEFKAKVCAGDVIACNYQVSFAKNAVLSPVSPKPFFGKGVMSLLPEDKDFSLCSLGLNMSCKLPSENTDQKAPPMLSWIRTGSLDSGIGSGMAGSGMAGSGKVGSGIIHPSVADCHPARSYSYSESSGKEYGMPENSCRSSMISGYFAGRDNSAQSTLSTRSYDARKLSLNIPVEAASPPFMVPTSTTTPEQFQPNLCYVTPLPEPAPQVSTQISSTRNNVSCWFNFSPDPPVLQNGTPDVQDVSRLGQQLDKNLVVSNQKVCSSCRGCGEGPARPTGVEMRGGQGPGQQTLTLPDMMPWKGDGRRSPVENAEWNTDDPNINSLMG
ncbi:hypothetical protein ACOMHN_027140 [Nucella lapillus]